MQVRFTVVPEIGAPSAGAVIEIFGGVVSDALVVLWGVGVVKGE